MKPWVIYHKKTGIIRGVFRFVDENAVDLQIRPGEAAIEGMADPLRHRVEKGKVIPCPRLQGDSETRDARRRAGDMARGCGQSIRAGFYSSALGAAHFYRNRESDQLTRLTALTLGMGVDLPCTDSAGNQTLRHHSPEQLQALCRDQLAWITACHRHLEKSNADRGVTTWTTPSTDHAEADQ